MTKQQAEPPADCALCPRLAEYRRQNQLEQPAWHNAPVAAFGDPSARLLIVGLAPGVTGANRTARPFTGDFAGDLLYATIAQFGLSTGDYDRRADDGLALEDCRITNAVRCVPPKNKPVAKEIANCRPFLLADIMAEPRPRALLALGRIAHDSILTCLGRKKVDFPFGHNVRHELEPGLALYDSYHCSRYNTNTRRLTPEMFEAVFERLKQDLGAA
jgi:uracil-DNA glycosylase family 4